MLIFLIFYIGLLGSISRGQEYGLSGDPGDNAEQGQFYGDPEGRMGDSLSMADDMTDYGGGGDAEIPSGHEDYARTDFGGSGDGGPPSYGGQEDQYAMSDYGGGDAGGFGAQDYGRTDFGGDGATDGGSPSYGGQEDQYARMGDAGGQDYGSADYGGSTGYADMTSDGTDYGGADFGDSSPEYSDYGGQSYGGLRSNGARGLRGLGSSNYGGGNFAGTPRYNKRGLGGSNTWTPNLKMAAKKRAAPKLGRRRSGVSLNLGGRRLEIVPKLGRRKFGDAPNLGGSKSRRSANMKRRTDDYATRRFGKIRKSNTRKNGGVWRSIGTRKSGGIRNLRGRRFWDHWGGPPGKYVKGSNYEESNYEKGQNIKVNHAEGWMRGKKGLRKPCRRHLQTTMNEAVDNTRRSMRPPQGP